jgi:amidase
VVIPVTRADQSIDKFDPDYVPAGELDKKNWEACASIHLSIALPHGPLRSEADNGRRTDDPEVYHGAPAAVQLLGCRLEEEKLLAIGQVITDALKSLQSSEMSAGGRARRISKWSEHDGWTCPHAMK